jgi:hypothetical protein
LAEAEVTEVAGTVAAAGEEPEETKKKNGCP